MKVYVVIGGEDVLAVCATRDLAERHLDAGLRQQYERDLAIAGVPLVRQGYKDGKGGIIPQVSPHPGTFEEWSARKGFSPVYIEEHDVEGAAR